MRRVLEKKKGGRGLELQPAERRAEHPQHSAEDRQSDDQWERLLQ